MPTRPINPDDPPNPPDVVVEAVLGAQVGNPPILPEEDAEGNEGDEVEPPPGALVDPPDAEGPLRP